MTSRSTGYSALTGEMLAAAVSDVSAQLETGVLWKAVAPRVTHDSEQLPFGRFEGLAEGAFRITPPSRVEEGRNRMHIQFELPFAAKSGDWIIVECRVRSVEGAVDAGGQAGMILALREINGDGKPAESSFYRHILLVGGDWERFQLPVEVRSARQSGAWDLVLTPSYFEQVVEIAELRIVASSPDAQTLTTWMYDGQRPDAPWRRRAEERIDRHRKGDVIVRVVDELGTPLPGASVTVQQLRHAYLFGSAVVAARLADSPIDGVPNRDAAPEEWAADTVRYREEFLRLFNCAVFENDLKWPQWVGEAPPGLRNQERTLNALHWLRKHRVVTKGHTMIWPSWRMTPKWLRDLEDSPDKLQAAILRHIRDIGTATEPFTAYWDVMNEPMSHRDILELLGTDQAAEWFRTARETLPDARLVLNEFDLVGNGGNAKRRTDLLALVAELREAGAPLDVIGFQGHFWSDRLTPPDRIWEIIDEVVAAAGLPVMISEFDMNFPNEQLQADYTRDFLTAWFAHPDTEAFIFWGFWAGAHWMGETAAMFRQDWSPKPSLKAYADLVLAKWWTDVDGMTDAEGRYQVRAFCGEHRIIVTVPGRIRAVREIVLGRDGHEVLVVLGPQISQ